MWTPIYNALSNDISAKQSSALKINIPANNKKDIL